MSAAPIKYRMKHHSTYKGVKVYQDLVFRYFEAEVNGDYGMRSNEFKLHKWIEEKLNKSKKAI